MARNEAQTRFELIDPALHNRGWTTAHIKVEASAGAIEVIDGRPRRKARGRMDYLLRLQAAMDTQPAAVALIEAKAEDKSPGFGLEQGKRYGDCSGNSGVSMLNSSSLPMAAGMWILTRFQD